MNEFFVSSYQKVASFRVVGNAKQGGNVAGYFMTPRGSVLDVIAGPVDAQTFLREARWAEETWKMLQLEAPNNVGQARVIMAKAHRDRLKADSTYDAAWAPPRNAPDTFQPGLDNVGKVNLLLAAYPLPKMEQIYKFVFEKILNEKVSTIPVVKT